MTRGRFVNRPYSPINRNLTKNKRVTHPLIFMFVFEKIGVYGFKMLVSYALTAVLMIIYQVPISWRMLYALPIPNQSPYQSVRDSYHDFQNQDHLYMYKIMQISCYQVYPKLIQNHMFLQSHLYWHKTYQIVWTENFKEQ